LSIVETEKVFGCPYSRPAFENAEHYRMCDLFVWRGCGESGWRDNFLKCDMLKLAEKILAEREETKKKTNPDTQKWQPHWRQSK